MSDKKERARIGRHEVQEILDRYDLGEILEIREFTKGSTKSPKARVRAKSGSYLLKRRAPGQDDPERVHFQHEVQLALQEQGYPTAGLVRTKQNANSVVKRGSRLYELFHFIEGKRYQKSEVQAKAAGYEMARMHDQFASYDGEVPKARGFHGVEGVDEALKRLPERLMPEDPHRRRGIAAICNSLSALHDESFSRLDDAGFSDCHQTVVHGDWHPGNLLYARDEVEAVLDFDSVRKEPRVAEVANGALQFSMQIGETEAIDRWPDSLDIGLLTSILRGYDEGTFEPLEVSELAMVPWLMIEALVVECIAPIAVHGRFGSIPGDLFLRHIERKVGWIRPRIDELISMMRKS